MNEYDGVNGNSHGIVTASNYAVTISLSFWYWFFRFVITWESLRKGYRIHKGNKSLTYGLHQEIGNSIHLSTQCCRFLWALTTFVQKPFLFREYLSETWIDVENRNHRYITAVILWRAAEVWQVSLKYFQNEMDFCSNVV